MDFHVGQKVVCVDASIWFGPWAFTADVPTVGQTYTIASLSAVDLRPERAAMGGPPLILREIRNVWPDGIDHGYRANRFRPLRTANIDVFLKMLEPQPVKELTHG